MAGGGVRRVYHPYWNWEDYRNGMWDILPKTEEPAMLQRAIEFTGDAVLYGSFMMRVAQEWPIACQQNLTNVGMNRKAWIGHAAASMAIKSPEYITRRAWGLLTDQQRTEANEMAQRAIDYWVRNWRKTRTVESGQYELPFCA